MHTTAPRFAERRPSGLMRAFGASALAALVACALFATQLPNAAIASPAAPSGTPATSDLNQAKKPAAQVPWKRVPEADRKVLAPIEPEWSKMPGHQQRKLLGAAKEYPKLAPHEQERFQERLKAWAHLTPEQRSAARERHQSLTNLPPEKQGELKARWQQEKATQPPASGTPAPPTTPPAPK
ncbi:MAG: DUF3106 domain-containing protein [Burkholderiales bacterium]